MMEFGCANHARAVTSNVQRARGRRPNTMRHSHHAVVANAALKAIAIASASSGCTKASASPPSTTPSSVVDAVQLLTGSGDR